MISGTTRMLGLLGESISHTLSPLIHNYAIKQFELDQIYVPLDISIKSTSEMKDF